MDLYQRVYNDIARITSNTNEWGCNAVITVIEGNQFTIAGLKSKHHLAVESDGNAVNSKNAHFSFSESKALAVGMTIRNSNQEISIVGYKCDVVDSSGIVKNYIIREVFPSETIGLIVCILGDIE